MTERQGVFPPEPRNGSEHFLRCSGNPVTCVWSGSHWLVPGWALARTSDQMVADGWTYLGPAPTYEQSRADAADARRFRWLASLDHGGTREIRLSGVKRNGDVWGHGINWSGTPCHADIRAAIDAAMKEDSNA